jgi:hypothetical protein
MRRTIATIATALAVGVALLAPTPARAAGPGVPLPAPFVVPTLEHDRLDLRVDSYVGRVTASPPSRPSSAAGLVRASAEGTILVPRLLYVGVALPFGGALPPDGGLAPGEAGSPSGVRTMLGNLEASVRATFPLPESLKIGFVLAATLPTARYDRDARGDRSAVDAFASLDPTNYPQFLVDRIGLRPAGDVRIVRGSLVIQGRHGIDIFIDTRGRETVKTAGRLALHVGWLLRRDTEVSVEAAQTYFISSDDPITTGGAAAAFAQRYRISDGHRSYIAAGPGIRFSLGEFDVGGAILTNISSPLSPVADDFIGLTLSVIGHAGSRPLPLPCPLFPSSC